MTRAISTPATATSLRRKNAGDVVTAGATAPLTPPVEADVATRPFARVDVSAAVDRARPDIAHPAQIAAFTAELVHRYGTFIANNPQLPVLAAHAKHKFSAAAGAVLNAAKQVSRGEFAAALRAPVAFAKSFVPPTLDAKAAAQLRAYNDAAAAALRDALTLGGVDKSKATAEVTAAFTAWVSGIAERQRLQPLSVVEHSAVLFVVRAGILDAHGDAADLRATLTTVLAASAASLCGTAHDANVAFQRLPHDVLRQAGAQARAFHSAAFQDVTRNPKHAKQQAIENLAPLDDYVLGSTDLVALVALAVAFATTGGAGVAGLLAGVATWSAAESLLHQYVYHATPTQIQWYKDYLGPIAPFLDRGARHHRFHHGPTYGASGFSVQFASAEDRARLDSKIARTEEPAAQKALHDSSYGLKLPPKEIAAWWIAQSPLYLGASALGAALGVPVAFFATLWATSALMPGGPAVTHPLVHEPADNIAQLKSPLLRMLMKSEWASKLARTHAGHHWAEGGIGDNWNLSAPALAGLLFGNQYEPNMKTLLRLREDRSLGGVWWEPGGNGAG